MRQLQRTHNLPDGEVVRIDKIRLDENKILDGQIRNKTVSFFATNRKNTRHRHGVLEHSSPPSGYICTAINSAVFSSRNQERTWAVPSSSSWDSLCALSSWVAPISPGAG